jgi:hypothetical protein
MPEIEIEIEIEVEAGREVELAVPRTKHFVIAPWRVACQCDA